MPALAAAVLFTITVLVSIAMVWMQPHSAGAAASPPATLSAGTGANSMQGDDPASGFTSGNHPGSGAESSTESSRDLPQPALFIHVTGEVSRPGVYELQPGDRVLAAIEAAGGATEQAVLSAVNLARPLVDGEQIIVPNADNIGAVGIASTPTGAAPPQSIAAPGSAAINLNTADAAALVSLPRIGPAIAQRIIDWREANGGFGSVDQLLNVSGIGTKTLDQLRHLVTI